MDSFKFQPSCTPGRLTILAIAIASALTAGQVSAAGPSYGDNNSGTIPTLDNPQGNTLQGSVAGILNSGSIGTLSSSGTIIGVIGVHNTGTITSLNNQTGGSINGNGTGIVNDTGASIGTLSNSGAIGVISGGYIGIHNNGTITSLSNTTGGTISGGGPGIFNDSLGSIETLSNSGTINGIQNSGSITSLNNNVGGTISGSTGIYNTGTITSLNNQTGAVSTVTARVFTTAAAPASGH